MKPDVTNFADMKEMCKRVNLLEPTEKIKVVAISLEKMITAFGKAVEDLNEREVELPEDITQMYLDVFADELDGGEEETGEDEIESVEEEEVEEGKPVAKKKPAAKKPAAKKAAPKDKPASKAKGKGKERSNKFAAWLTGKLTEKSEDYTRKELLDMALKEFPDYAPSTVATMITDAKNPKYSILKFAMTEDKETKICKLSETKTERNND